MKRFHEEDGAPGKPYSKNYSDFSTEGELAKLIKPTVARIVGTLPKGLGSKRKPQTVAEWIGEYVAMCESIAAFSLFSGNRRPSATDAEPKSFCSQQQKEAPFPKLLSGLVLQLLDKERPGQRTQV